MLSDFLIKIIVIFLPTQLGLHFWPAFSRVAGIRVDYLSPTLYFLDILLLLLVILNLKQILSFLNQYRLLLSIFLSFIVLNVVFSVSPLNSIFWWLRFLLYLLVFLVFRLRKLRWENIRYPLLLSTIAIIFLEITQLKLQTSVGGLFYYLGERAFTTSTPGIGRFNLLGLEILRPMSTFSHPNSLAGYLLVVFYLFLKKPTKFWYRLVPFFGIILTFSKSSILVLAFLIFKIKPEIVILFSLILTLVQPTLQNISIKWQPISDRLFFFTYLKKIPILNSITGIGLGSFIPFLGKNLPGSFITPAKLQPIHNLLYLFVSELGILGTILSILILIKQKVYKIITTPAVLELIAIVIFTGSLDHYSWTLPQNKLIFILALSILF